ncbi:hypothetical protein N9X52_03585 [Candidatus Poseidonia alphae]|nr:hypothetical protein [Candidatus Poseidonia alphae]
MNEPAQPKGETMFTGTIESQSHEGGLLVRFEGSSPSLDAILVLAENGTYVGKVDGVLGSTNQPMAHIGHIDRELKLDDLLGSHVTIRAKKPRQDREKFRRDSRDSRDRSGGNDRRNDSQRDHRGDRGDRGDRREQRSSFNDNDWTCPECKNSNFAFRQACNRCEAPRPGGGGGSRDNGGRSDRRPQRDGGRYEQRGGNNRQEIYNDNDWTCRECNNSNFAFRQACNRCEAPRPGGGGGRSGGGRGGDRRSSGGSRDGGRGYGGGDRGGDRRSSGGSRDGGRGYGGGDRGGDRRSSGGDRRDNNRRPQSTDSNFRHAKGKRPGHAHNRGPNDLQPRKPDRYDD